MDEPDPMRRAERNAADCLKMISKRRASTDRQRGAIDLSAKALVPAAQLLISGSRPIDAPGRVFFLNHLAPGPKI
jgi:hypothetical protein